ncbi:hypothetical protein HYX16_03730 [Candidatus Woesearchaeota archaeon]|nr:hypothetical protein [Candidatus Woesearchaeota archaeon]
MKALSETVEKFKEGSVIVAGDLILEENIRAIKSEKIDSEGFLIYAGNYARTYNLDGAANVFVNIAALQGRAYLCGVIGGDYFGDLLYLNLQKQFIQREKRSSFTSNFSELKGVIGLKDRKTALKTRIYVDNNKLAKLVEEAQQDVDKTIVQNIIERFEFNEGIPRVLIFSDYKNGFLNSGTVRLFRKYCEDQKLKIKIIVDFKHLTGKPERLEKYIGCYGFKLDLIEAQEMSGIKSNGENLEEISKKCAEILQPQEFLLITMGSNGMFLDNVWEGTKEYIPAVRVENPDIAGAEDAVTASLSLALATGAIESDAARIANYSASIAASKKGAVSKKELIDLIEKVD